MVELFDSQNQTVDDCLEPNDAALWQASKGDIAVIDSAQLLILVLVYCSSE